MSASTPTCLAGLLTLDSCLTLAKANSPTLKQGGLSLHSADLAKQELKSTGLPQLRLSAGALFAPATTQFGYDPTLTDRGQFGSQVILEQPLYDGGRRHLKALQGDLDISLLTHEQKLVTRDLEFAVRQSFIENLRAQQEIDLRELAVRELTEYLDLVNHLHAGGQAAQTDVLRTQVELANATIALSNSKQRMMEARYQLAGLMGGPADSLWAAGDSLGESQPLPITAVSLAGVADTSRNLELAVAHLDYERTASDIKAAQKEHLPTVNLVADAGLLTSRDNLEAPTSDRYHSWGYSVGLSLDLPLVDWGGRKLRIQQRQLAAESVRLQAELVRRNYETAYRSAVTRLVSSQSQLQILRGAIQKAVDNFLLTKAKYLAGDGLASEVLSAQQLVTDTQLAALDTLTDIQLVLAQMAYLNAQ